MQVYLGRCHCGALGLSYSTALLPPMWEVRACQCAFCRAHGGLTTSDPAGTLSLSVSDESLLRRYRFGTGMTEFWICGRCGVYVGATMEGFGVINVRALNPMRTDLSEPVPMQYGQESAQGRRDRRRERWTPLLTQTR